MPYKKILEIADILNGFAFQSKRYVENGIRVIRIANVQDGKIVDEQPCFYPSETRNEIEKYMLKEGDLLVSLTGNVGRVGLIPGDMLPAALNQRVCCLRLKKDNIDLKYLFLYLRRKDFVRECIKASKGVAQLNLSTKWLENYEIPLPSLSEQKRIVDKIKELFSELDSAIETLKKTKEQLAVYRQSVLKETFKKYETSKKVPITELVVDGKYALAIGPFGSNLKVSDYTNNGVRLVFVKDIRNSFSSETTKYVSEAKATELTPHCVYQGDLLITKMGDPPGDCCVYPYAGRGVITSDCIRMKVDEAKMDKMCLLLYIHSAYGKKQIKGMTQGVAQKKISLERFKKFEVPRIDILEQKELVKKIQSRMSVCENMEKTVNDALIQAEAMRQSILKKAFEGGL